MRRRSPLRRSPRRRDNASSAHLAAAGRQPGLRVYRLTLSAQFQIQSGVALRRRAHGADRFSGQHPLPNAAVDATQSGQEGMISLAVFDDQYKAVASEWSRKKDAGPFRGYGLILIDRKSTRLNSSH